MADHTERNRTLDDALRAAFESMDEPAPVAWLLITAGPPDDDGGTIYGTFSPPGQAYHVDLGLAHHLTDLATADFEEDE